MAYSVTLLGCQEVELGVPIEMMDLRVISPYRCCPNSFGKVSKKRQAGTKHEEAQRAFRVIRCELDTFDGYVCDSKQTVDCDDIEIIITIENTLFKRMLVHTYYSNKGRNGASEIIDKVARKLINPNDAHIGITKKDWYHRLLPSIPWNGLEDHHTCFPLLLKNKIFFLKIDSCVHQQTEIKVCNEHTRVTTPITDGDQIQQEFNKLLALTKIG